MLYRIMAASLKYIVKADKIAFDIYVRIADGVPDTRLGGQINHQVKIILLKEIIY